MIRFVSALNTYSNTSHSLLTGKVVANSGTSSFPVNTGHGRRAGDIRYSGSLSAMCGRDSSRAAGWLRCHPHGTRGIQIRPSTFLVNNFPIFVSCPKTDACVNRTASEIKIKRVQGGTAGETAQPTYDPLRFGIGIDMASGSADESADRALSSVTRKLDKSLSVEYTVNQLIAEATDLVNLALMFVGE